MNILNARLEITNPFDRWELFKPLGCISARLTKNKSLELEHSYMSTMLVDFDLLWTVRTDHAGFRITVGILGYGIGFQIYDTRHWNYERDQYEIYDTI
jgi:hypothetical protein